MKGSIGEYLTHLSKFKTMKGDIKPGIVKNGELVVKFDTHEGNEFFIMFFFYLFRFFLELDEWHNQFKESYSEYGSLLKGFHRAFQMKGDLVFFFYIKIIPHF